MVGDASDAPETTARKPRGRTPLRRRDRAATEEKLLKAAVRAFSKNGFDRTTTRIIARTAGVNESLIIRYFGTKEGLLREIIRRHAAAKRQVELGYPPQGTLEAELIEYARWMMAQQDADIDLVRIVLSRAIVDPRLRADLCVETALTDQRLAMRLAELVKTGGVPWPIDLQGVAYAVNTIVFGTKIFSTLLLGEPIESTTHRVEHLITQYARGLSGPGPSRG